MTLRSLFALNWWGLFLGSLVPYQLAYGQAEFEWDSTYIPVFAVLVALAALLWAAWFWSRKSPYAYLYFLKGDNWKRQSVRTEVCRIGRHPNNEIHIPEKSISRFHAEIVRHRNGTFSIYDVSSTNGIRVGARPVSSSFLSDGEIIDLGNVRFRFTRLPRDYQYHQKTEILDLPVSRFNKRRRHEHREEVKTQVRVYNDGTGWINGWMRNTGREGAFIETDAKLAPRLPVDVVAAITEGSRRRWLRISAEVVWSDSKGLGVRFTDGDPESLDELIGIVNSADTQGRVLH